MEFIENRIVYFESLPIKELKEDTSFNVFSNIPRAASPVRGSSSIRSRSPVRTESPIRIRNKSPVKKSKKNIYISTYSLTEIKVNEESNQLIKIDLDILNKLNIDTNLDKVYDIQDIFINFENLVIDNKTLDEKMKFIKEIIENEAYMTTMKDILKDVKIVFMIKYWGFNVPNITKEIRKYFSTFEYININNVNMIGSGDVKLNSYEAIKNYPIRIQTIVDWKLLRILGKDNIVFEVCLNKIHNTFNNFYKTFTQICRGDEILNSIFIDITKKYVEETRQNMEKMNDDFLRGKYNK